MNWWRNLKGKISFDEPLKKHTTFKIGGPAKFFVSPADTPDLKLLVTLAKIHKIPVFVLGAGSNILAADRGIKGIALKLNSPFFTKVSNPNKSNYLEAGSGLALRDLIQEAKERYLSGIEFLAGIPGTVGGALAMNAGAWGRNIGDLVEKVSIMDYNGRIKVLKKKDMKFGYRKSNLAKYIILGACLKLGKRDKGQICANIKRYLMKRRHTQSARLPNAGCVFKNPPGGGAGRLIDLAGLKGKRSGRAIVSARHANFILNQGSARASDVLKLMSLIKRKVRERFNINLEPEIKIWR